MSDKKVTKLPVAFKPPEPPKLAYRTESDWAQCDHHPIDYEIDEPTGRVRCKQCGCDLNPIWALKQLYFLVEENYRRIKKKYKK